MVTQELEVRKDIEIKFYRLSLPSFNTSNLPLSGLYQDIDNIEEKKFPINNKFMNFDLSHNFGIDNLFTLSSSFGKVFLKEKLDGLIIFSNISDYYVTIKDLKISIIIEAKNDTNKKDNTKNENILDIKLPPKGIKINPHQAHSVKMSISLDYVSKYTIDINLRTKSIEYNKNYNLLKLKGHVKETKDYKIVNGEVEYLNNKKLTFDVNNPFIVKEKFHNYQMNTCYIETHITNNTIYPLTIYSLSLYPKSKKNLKISDLLLSSNSADNKLPLVQSLEEINNNENEDFDKLLSNSSFKTRKSKYITMEQDEEFNLIFKNNDPSLFSSETKFVLDINWLNLFDPLPKKFSYEFKNVLSTFNDFYKITVLEKPKGEIKKNENFNIILNLETKNPEKKYIIALSQEPLKDKDKSDDREIEIIDIIEKKIELNKEKQNNNITLICKSDIIGNVYLPRLKFLVYEENKNPMSNVYDALLFFNCIEN
jgi:hypothetical protein